MNRSERILREGHINAEKDKRKTDVRRRESETLFFRASGGGGADLRTVGGVCQRNTQPPFVHRGGCFPVYKTAPVPVQCCGYICFRFTGAVQPEVEIYTDGHLVCLSAARHHGFCRALFPSDSVFVDRCGAGAQRFPDTGGLPFGVRGDRTGGAARCAGGADLYPARQGEKDPGQCQVFRRDDRLCSCRGCGCHRHLLRHRQLPRKISESVERHLPRLRLYILLSCRNC